MTYDVLVAEATAFKITGKKWEETVAQHFDPPVETDL